VKNQVVPELRSTRSLWINEKSSARIAFGHRVAEEETDVLSTYFVETDHWQRLYRGDIDVVYGPKGSGKSALYSLLLSKSTELFDRSILLVAGENPRGATAFRDLMTDPPLRVNESSSGCGSSTSRPLFTEP